jgi:hypothetical protein
MNPTTLILLDKTPWEKPGIRIVRLCIPGLNNDSAFSLEGEFNEEGVVDLVKRAAKALNCGVDLPDEEIP